MNKIIEGLKGGIIVSCQALENEPLHSSYIMSRMAYAAKEGGAIGIRANSYEDIAYIKKTVDLPILGIVKRDYEDSEIYITPTMTEVDELVKAKADIIALDATNRIRPNNISLEEFIKEIRSKYDDLLLMADVSTFEEGITAWRLGFDIVSTTLSGYTSYTEKLDGPDFKLIKELSENIDRPVIAEGRIWTREDSAKAINMGAFAVVVGTAVTRPREITERFVKALSSL
ncbi:N-acetylmannosamine-6-phosphate 2-epimerase [Clostridium swellfunianum]|uniref:N-acetylmannosamine-6-phosphate 2-epimerase n=1 Tax=Clostridium swellfunianum TaxID=1367462 RepID=UPI00202E19B0|nr:N-acetylmannosamine-6-phosphate 2-epimerase [Clostridium swellfunianum]MCM0647580.1 N-acetylmannosamine-6-phosphate 2-epimerase [Clostridium swellfunianum]